MPFVRPKRPAILCGIVIADMQMPGMDSASLARVIKSDQKLKDIQDELARNR